MDKGRQREKSKVVIDASVAAKWIIPGEPWEAHARTLKGKIASMEIEAYAPPLLLYEVAYVILKSVSTGILKLSDGIEALKTMGHLGLSIQTASWNDLAEILSIAAATKLTVYDAAYLHLSKKMKAKLITADSELKKRGESVTATILLKELEI